jgi:hypothetical protein
MHEAAEWLNNIFIISVFMLTLINIYISAIGISAPQVVLDYGARGDTTTVDAMGPK